MIKMCEMAMLGFESESPLANHYTIVRCTYTILCFFYCEIYVKYMPTKQCVARNEKRMKQIINMQYQ